MKPKRTTTKRPSGTTAPANRPAEAKALRPLRARPAPELFGVYSATVTDTRDPLALGRVKVVVTSISKTAVWARLATLMAGNERGTWFVPDAGDEVLVAFAAGDPNSPCVVGALWSTGDRPPETMDSGGQNYKRVIRSKGGLKITLNDQDVSLVLETRGGHKVVLSDSSESITITDLNGNKFKLEPSGITISASAKLTIEAASSVEVSAGMVQINSGMCKATGVVQCDTLIAKTVISETYTPGAGNVM